jgi:hypothetical protein
VTDFGGSGELGGKRENGALGCFDGFAIGNLDGWAGGGVAYASAIWCSRRGKVMASGTCVDNSRMVGQIVGGWDCSIGSY